MTSPEPVMPSTQAIITAKRKRHLRLLEITATLLLSAATVFTAWSAFQSTKWSGIQAIRFNQASASRAESIRASTIAGQQSISDSSVFTAWLSATDQGQTQLAQLLAKHFDGEFKVAFQAWESTNPFTNPAAPSTPFAMPEYQLASEHLATAFEAKAAKQFNQATQANQRSDNYILMTVLFSMVLFFGAISTRFELIAIQISLISIAGLIFIVAVAITVMFPIKI